MNDRHPTPPNLEETHLGNAQQHISAALRSLLNTNSDLVSLPSSQILDNPTQDQRPAAMQKNMAPFLNKVYIMVGDSSSDKLIRWSTNGKSFFILRHEDFARSVLPKFFKHSNFSSFVRQLNMYGFHKVPHLQNGVLHSDHESEQWEFSNPHFQRNQPDLLSLITRRKGRDSDEKEPPPVPTSTNIDLQHILKEIQVIKQHQLNISSQLEMIQSDNTVMWQEATCSRENNQRHQDTIDKILRFLASVFSNDKSPAISRKRQHFLEAPDTNNTDQHDGEYLRQKQRNNNADNGRPSKMPKTKKVHEFRMEDYPEDFARTPSPTPTAIPTPNPLSSVSASTKSTNPTSELDDAIALNHKSKQISSTASLRSSVLLPPELTQMMTSQQIQGLQNLINLAQSNPALLSQFTTEAFNASQHQDVATNDNMPTTTTTPVSTSVPEYSHINDTIAFDASNKSDNNSDKTSAIIPSPVLGTPSLPHPQQRYNAATHVSSTRTNESHHLTNAQDARYDLPVTNQSHSWNTTQASNQSKRSPAPTTMFQPTRIRSTTIRSTGINTLISATNSSDTTHALSSIQHISRSADSVDGNINTLGSNIEALIRQIGLTPMKSNEDTLGYVDID